MNEVDVYVNSYIELARLLREAEAALAESELARQVDEYKRLLAEAEAEISQYADANGGLPHDNIEVKQRLSRGTYDYERICEHMGYTNHQRAKHSSVNWMKLSEELKPTNGVKNKYYTPGQPLGWIIKIKGGA